VGRSSGDEAAPKVRNNLETARGVRPVVGGEAGGRSKGAEAEANEEAREPEARGRAGQEAEARNERQT
jgi:hypothetical protein